MDYPRLLNCLDADFTRLRQVAAPVLGTSDLTTSTGPRVPNCPDWTLDDLAYHVGMVYWHKAECMRQGKFPEWPPEDTGEPTLDLLDRAHAALVAEFAARKPEEHAVTWYEPEQTVGFWIRRMAHETVVHRVDAEQAAGVPLAEIPDDLALDGVDEVLERFLAYGSTTSKEDFTGSLPAADRPPVLVGAGERGWLVRAKPDGVVVEPAAPGAPAPATVSGAPVAMLLWLWRRADAGVRREGDAALIEGLSTLLRDATQ
jgi:uncharacterized protein (TIGR03083 family)